MGQVGLNLAFTRTGNLPPMWPENVWPAGADDRGFVYLDSDPFRLKIQKCMTLAFSQIEPTIRHVDSGVTEYLTSDSPEWEAAETAADSSTAGYTWVFRNDLHPTRSDNGRVVITVGRGRRYYDENDPLPLVSILEEPFSFDEELAPATGQSQSDPYELIIQGFVREEDSNNPTDGAHVLLADVKRRLAILKADEEFRRRRMFRLGNDANTVVSLNWDGGVVRPSDEVSAVAHFWLRVSFGISEDHDDPYSHD